MLLHTRYMTSAKVPTIRQREAPSRLDSPDRARHLVPRRLPQRHAHMQTDELGGHDGDCPFAQESARGVNSNTQRLCARTPVGPGTPARVGGLVLPASRDDPPATAPDDHNLILGLRIREAPLDAIPVAKSVVHSGSNRRRRVSRKAMAGGRRSIVEGKILKF